MLMAVNNKNDAHIGIFKCDSHYWFTRGDIWFIVIIINTRQQYLNKPLNTSSSW
jgi:hypothetical protein